MPAFDITTNVAEKEFLAGNIKLRVDHGVNNGHSINAL
jgi:hypothetical protein